MLLVFGSINVDFVFPLPRLPKPGDTLQGACRTGPGGKGANQAVAAARDGADVKFIGAVGHDGLAEVALTGLRAARVDVGHVTHVNDDTGRAMICVDPAGYTTAVVDPGANQLARAAQVPDALLGRHTTLLLQLEPNALETASLILRARQRGARVILLMSPSQPVNWNAVRAVDVLLGNTQEFAWAGEQLGTGNNPASLHAALGVTAVRMMGVQGVDAMSSAGYQHMPAVSERMRDTSGASDCFTGVLAAALDRHASLARAMRRAAAAASLSITAIGANSSMPNASAIDAKLFDAPLVSNEQPEVVD